MRLDKNGIRFLKEVEGVERYPYQDSAGHWTIGVGHLLTKQELRDYLIGWGGTGWSDTKINQYLKQDVKFAEDAVNQHCKVRLYQDEFNALVSFTFNLGVGAFRRSTLLRLLNQSLYEEVPNQLRRWNRAGGRVVQGLKNRREKEVILWEKAKL